MPTLWPARIVPASRVSVSVAARLAAGSRDVATVHSVFRSALNLSTADGLLTVAATSIGGLPNGINADLATDVRTLGLRAGMSVIVDAGSLFVAETGLMVELAGAEHWSPRLRPVEIQRTDWRCPNVGQRWRSRSRSARSAAAGVADRSLPATRGGLGSLLGPADRLAARGAGAEDQTIERARPALADLGLALRCGDRDGATAMAKRVIGLGPGLTPSCDDAVAGVEAALWAFGSPMAGFSDRALDDVDSRTTAVAATLLRHAAAGEFAERLHGLMAALLGADDGAIPAAIERAAVWGATSGIDCLVGVLLGLDAAADDRKPRN